MTEAKIFTPNHTYETIDDEKSGWQDEAPIKHIELLPFSEEKMFDNWTQAISNPELRQKAAATRSLKKKTLRRH